MHIYGISCILSRMGRRFSSNFCLNKHMHENQLQHLQEGAHDPHIFKAIFMAGAPGSGKSTVRNQLFGGMGLKLTDADEVRSAYLRMGKPGDYTVYGTIAKKQHASYTEQRLGIIMDRTAWWAPTIRETHHQLDQLGYDQAMIHVWVPLEASLQRARERAVRTGRSVPEQEIIKRYEGLQQNIRDYSQMFGDQFWFVDNQGGNPKLDLVRREISQWLRKPPESPQAQAWIQSQKRTPIQEHMMGNKKPRKVSAGVIITDGEHILLGHTTNGTYWDIPKGGIDSGESALQAAIRELREETGLTCSASDLITLGKHAYTAKKDLELFLWPVHKMPDATTLHCVSKFHDDHTKSWLPELDDFAVVNWSHMRNLVNPNLNRVMNEIESHVQSALSSRNRHR
jgi:8-oxo-dGTP pyrophosphatase MutT (NUDIX family)/predicted ABC-type ATPase